MREPSTSLASLPQQPAAAAEASGVSEQERKLKQYLEDERIALFLQNEEFMKELQRNREFLDALERGTESLLCCEVYTMTAFTMASFIDLNKSNV